MCASGVGLVEKYMSLEAVMHIDEELEYDEQDLEDITS
jgi:hypothetical protein